MLIGLLQCGHFPQSEIHPRKTYSELYADMLDGQGFTFETWSVVDMEFPASVHDADAWLLSGSRHGAYDDLPFIRPLEDLIRDIYAARLPMVGICFGHQIVAQALGGKVIKSPKGWTRGRVTYDIDGAEATLNAWHQDEVAEVPSDATVVGSSPSCAIAMLKYAGNAITLQPHPEFGDQDLQTLLDGPAAKLMSSAEKNACLRGLGTPDNNAWMAGKIAAFLKNAKDTSAVHW
jgi:GMP synthase (glutamine-hydrolysing)